MKPVCDIRATRVHQDAQSKPQQFKLRTALSENRFRFVDDAAKAERP